jgi:hypothetical protein
MRRLMISAFAAVALLAAATTMVRLHSSTAARPAVTTGMMSLQELHSQADVNKLPSQDFEDQSLVYPTKRK